MMNSQFILSAIVTLCLGGDIVSPAGQIPDIPTDVVELLLKSTCEKGCSPDEVALWKRNLKSERRDLNNDGVQELFLYIDHSDWCGAGSNCDYWVFQKSENSYIMLLNDKELKVKETVTNGYNGLSSETPMGFCGRNVQQMYVTPYRYDGTQYRSQPQKVDCIAFVPPSGE